MSVGAVGLRQLKETKEILAVAIGHMMMNTKVATVDLHPMNMCVAGVGLRLTTKPMKAVDLGGAAVDHLDTHLGARSVLLSTKFLPQLSIVPLRMSDTHHLVAYLLALIRLNHPKFTSCPLMPLRVSALSTLKAMRVRDVLLGLSQRHLRGSEHTQSHRLESTFIREESHQLVQLCYPRSRQPLAPSLVLKASL